MTQATTDARTADFMALAMEMAARARTVVLSHYGTAPDVEAKDDQSPVTIADRQCEAAMREMINARFPDHGIYGEEYGVENADADFVWVLDPIDGTKAFVTGKPLFGTLIGLLKEGVPYLGVMDNPALDEVWAGAPGGPATCNGEAVHARACAGLADAWLYSTSPQMHEGLHFDRFERLRHACRYGLFGGDCYSFGVLAKGRVDLVCESSMQPYDYVALVPIVEAAGGRMTDWSGRTLGLTGDGTVIAAGDPALHDAATAILGG